MKQPRTSTAPQRRLTHDSGYKLLYAHSAMVRDLLRGFVPGEWVQALDFATLERCSGSYVTDDLRDRADDLIWRVRWGEDWLYVYLLLDEQRLAQSASLPVCNLSAALFQLEASRSSGEAMAIVQALIGWLADPV